MSDVNCPYCGVNLEINQDHGYGYEEDRKHEQQCRKCEKVFVYTTSIHIYHEAEVAPCLNGADHDMKPVTHYPRIFPDWKRCSCCEHEVKGRYDESAIEILRKSL
jgi:hypothetical protein